MSRTPSTCIGLASALIACAAANAQPWIVEDLGASAAGPSMALTITDEGDIVGVESFVAIDGSARVRYFVWQPRAGWERPTGLTPMLPVPGITALRAEILTGVSPTNLHTTYARGAIWTASASSPQSPRQTITTGKNRQELTLRDINDLGRAVGVTTGPLSNIEPHERHSVRQADEPAREQPAQDEDDERFSAFYWDVDAGEIVPLSQLPGAQTGERRAWRYAAPAGINDQGLIVGIEFPLAVSSAFLQPFIHPAIQALDGDTRGIVWKDEVPILADAFVLNNWKITRLYDINNRGEAVGQAISPEGDLRAVVLRPEIVDLDADGKQSPRDFRTLLDFLQRGDPRGDLNADGRVDSADFTTWLAAFNKDDQKPDLNAPEAGASELAIDFRVTGVVTAYELARETRGGGAGGVQPGSDPDVMDQYLQWIQNSTNWNTWHVIFNPDCFGCSGNEPGNDLAPSGAPGWPGDNIFSPYFPNGGPGGPGADATPDSGHSGGHGGDGGNGGPGGDGGPGGRGGNADGASGGGQGGAGGSGADAAPNSPAPGGAGGRGGDGGFSPSGLGGSGGSGGPGGATSTDATNGQNNGGPGGDGGNGGGSNTGNAGHGGAGGSGGDSNATDSSGGDGGKGGSGGDSSSGRGGAGARGGDGGSGDAENPGAGNGGDGGQGGDGGSGSVVSPGGSGGRGGNGGQGQEDGDPGTGGSGGAGGWGTPPGNPGNAGL